MQNFQQFKSAQKDMTIKEHINDYLNTALDEQLEISSHYKGTKYFSMSDIFNT